MAEKRNQNDDGDGYTDHQKKNRTHVKASLVANFQYFDQAPVPRTTVGRCTRPAKRGEERTRQFSPHALNSCRNPRSRRIAKQSLHDPVACPQWSRRSSRKTHQSREQQMSTTMNALSFCGRYLRLVEPPQTHRTRVSRRRVC